MNGGLTLRGSGPRPRAARAVLAMVLAIAAGIILFFIADKLFPFPEEKLYRAPATIVFDRDGAPLRVFLPSDQKYRFPVKLSELPPELERAIIASEDRHFYRHPGIDPFAFARASWSNLRARHVVSGASTIPMQIARMAQPRRRSLLAKAIESFRALQLTAHHSKRELLEIYLNSAPYGSNIEGVGAASYFYFGKSASQLSLGEIALLTTLPRAPNRYDPFRDAKTARRARDLVLAQLQQRGAFSAREIAEARRQSLPGTRLRVPFLAPHWCELARHESHDVMLQTTLDRRMQRIAEQRVAARIGELRARGVENAAVVIIDNHTREVRAMVGSAAFFDARYDGQNNGAIARRSPGSALKPFLYAKAMDDGRVVPDSYLFDIPTDFGGYVAENYDGTYRGRVTVREALVGSLNAPAVRLLSDEGVDSFLTVLRRGGLRTLDRRAGEYGLPLILGSGEVRLVDLTNLYATLAEHGVHKRWTMFRSPESPHGERLFSREAAALVTSMMCELKRPDMPQGWELTADTPRIAWKTGTSYGHRDAWSIGFSARYSIGVWVGNFDGHGVNGLSGSQHAAPLLFDIFRAVDQSSVVDQTPQLGGIDEVEVCALSHQLPTPQCPHRVRIKRIVGVTHLHSCTEHQLFIVDRKSGERLTGGCVATHSSMARVFEVAPPELVSYRRANGEAVQDLPPLSASCHDIESADAPRIVAPDGNTPYRIRRDAPLQYQEIRLAAHAGSDAETLYWYQDGVLVATQRSGHAAFVAPQFGTHRLAVVDDLGRSSSISYEVQ